MRWCRWARALQGRQNAHLAAALAAKACEGRHNRLARLHVLHERAPRIGELRRWEGFAALERSLLRGVLRTDAVADGDLRAPHLGPQDAVVRLFLLRLRALARV